MSERTSGGWEKTLRETITSVIIVVAIGAAFITAQQSLGLNFPSVNQATGQLWAAIQIWTNIASVESPKEYALNAMILLTFSSAALNSYNRDSPSSTISGIFTAPGVAIWSKILTRFVDIPFIGTIIYGIGGALRLYLWVGSLMLYYVYAFLYVQNSDVSLFVVTTSVILASVTFGSLFGRFEKGLVLSINSTAESVREWDIRGQQMWKNICWALMIPVAVSIAFYVTSLSAPSLVNTTIGQFISTSTSVFLSTSLMVIAVFYLVAASGLFISFCLNSIRSHREGNWELRDELQAHWKKYIKEEFSKGKSNENKFGFPDDVADAMRKQRQK